MGQNVGGGPRPQAGGGGRRRRGPTHVVVDLADGKIEPGQEKDLTQSVIRHMTHNF